MNSDLDLYFSDSELARVFNCKLEVVKIYHQRYRTIMNVLEGKARELSGQNWPGSILISLLYKNPVKLIQLFDEARKPDHQPYASNTKKGWYDLLINLLPAWRNKLKITERADHTVALTLYSREKERLAAEYVHRPRPNEVTAEQIRNGIETLPYGSKERALLSLYMEVPVRDDLQLRLVKSREHVEDDKVNYIYIDKALLRLCVMIQKSKNVGMDKKQKPREYVLSEGLTKEMVSFFMRATPRRDFPFGTGKLYKYVGSALHMLGLKKGPGAINIIRRALANEARDKGPEEMADWAYKMCHTTATSVVAYEDNTTLPAMEQHSDNSQEPTEPEDNPESQL